MRSSKVTKPVSIITTPLGGCHWVWGSGLVSWCVVETEVGEGGTTAVEIDEGDGIG